MALFLNERAIWNLAALVLLLFSIICRVMTGVALKKLAAEAENMSTTQNGQLRQCKVKFQNYYELNDGNMNVEVFVEKFMQSIRLGKCSLRMMNLVAGQLLLLFVLFCGIASCRQLAEGRTFGEVLPCYLLAFGGLYLYFALSGLLDVQGRQEALKTTIVDFLENRMGERVKSVKKDSAYLDEVEKLNQTRVWDAAQVEQKLKESTCAGETSQHVESAENMPDERELIKNAELEALLTEFLA
ncbi:MAG: hypothetical protein IJ390_08705 [Lachnospiraceae bacterium]|nr:hypothetical protein [Lachnospiraceae bacterium]